MASLLQMIGYFIVGCVAACVLLTLVGWLIHRFGGRAGSARQENEALQIKVSKGWPPRPTKPEPGEGATGVTVATATFTRAQIAARLAELACATPPAETGPQAMCYSMSGPPRTATYHCPRCGSRTEYAVPSDGWGASPDVLSLLQWHLDRWRRLTRELDSGRWRPEREGATAVPARLRCELDETALCKSCTPATEEPRLALVLHYPDEEKPHVIPGVGAAELQLLEEFLSGSLSHELSFGATEPLRKHLVRLELILGVSVGGGPP